MQCLGKLWNAVFQAGAVKSVARVNLGGDDAFAKDVFVVVVVEKFAVRCVVPDAREGGPRSLADLASGIMIIRQPESCRA